MIEVNNTALMVPSWRIHRNRVDQSPDLQKNIQFSLIRQLENVKLINLKSRHAFHTIIIMNWKCIRTKYSKENS